MGLSKLPAGLLSSYAPGILARRSHGVIPSLVAPECLGDSNRLLLLYAQRGCGSLATSAMTKFISRDAKLKGPKVVDWSSLGELR